MVRCGLVELLAEWEARAVTRREWGKQMQQGRRPRHLPAGSGGGGATQGAGQSDLRGGGELGW